MKHDKNGDSSVISVNGLTNEKETDSYIVIYNNFLAQTYI